MNNEVLISEVKKMISHMEEDMERLRRLIYALEMDRDNRRIEEQLRELTKDNAENTKSELNSHENEKANDNIALLSTTPKGGVAKPESSRAINGDGSSPDTQIQNEINKDYEEQ